MYSTALGVAVVAWAIHMWFDWDFDIPGVTLPLLVFLGVLAARPAGAGGVELPPAGPAAAAGASVAGRSLALGLGAVAACAIALSALLPSLAHDRTDRALSEAAAGHPKGLAAAAKDAEVARRLNPLSVDPLFAEASVAERGQRFARISRLLADAADREPRNPAVWLRLAGFADLLGDRPAVDRYLRDFLVVNPHYRLTPVLILVLTDASASASATGTPLPQAPARVAPRPAPRAFAFPPAAPGQPPLPAAPPATTVPPPG
jgi:hypothetical protein